MQYNKIYNKIHHSIKETFAKMTKNFSNDILNNTVWQALLGARREGEMETSFGNRPCKTEPVRWSCSAWTLNEATGALQCAIYGFPTELPSDWTSGDAVPGVTACPFCTVASIDRLLLVLLLLLKF